MCQFCIDRILPRDEFAPNNAARIALLKAKKWPVGATLDIALHRSATRQQRHRVQETINEWMRHANIKFVIGDKGADADIRITFDPGSGAWSYLGTDAKRVARNRATMNLGFDQGGTYLHEFGHALGAIHEHQSPFGGIKWNKQAVIEDLSGPPNNWDRQTIERNIFQKYDEDQLNGSEFDPQSIMLYSIPQHWTLDDFSADANPVLSQRDKEWIREQYPFDDDPVEPTEPIELEVIDLAYQVDFIGEVGERDLFRLDIEEAGKYRFELRGPVAVKLFGPNSKTRLVKEDDNSNGDSYLVVPVTLNPGEYLLQVSHAQERGTDAYKVRVLKLADNGEIEEGVGDFVIKGKAPLKRGTYFLES